MTSPTPLPHLSAIRPYKAGKTSQTPDVSPIKLSSNENPYGASPEAIVAYQNAAASLHRYPDGSCTALREALGDVHHIPAQHIVCGSGSDELISLLINAYAGDGDEVLFTEHAFLMYRLYTLSAGATPVEAPEVDLRADIDLLLAHVSNRTKILFLANPNNPTGSYLSGEQLQLLRARLPAHIILAIDGAYAECCDARDYDNGQSLATSTDNTIMLRTFSKIYGLPALRLGWMVGHDTIINAINRIKSPFNITAPAQAAGIAALRDQQWLQEQYRLNLAGRTRLAHACSSLGLHVYDSQANFILVDCGSVDQAQHILTSLEKRHIYVRDVASYKLPQCIRISVGTISDNDALVDALRTIL